MDDRMKAQLEEPEAHNVAPPTMLVTREMASLPCARCNELFNIGEQVARAIFANGRMAVHYPRCWRD